MKAAASAIHHWAVPVLRLLQIARELHVVPALLGQVHLPHLHPPFTSQADDVPLRHRRLALAPLPPVHPRVE